MSQDEETQPPEGGLTGAEITQGGMKKKKAKGVIDSGKKTSLAALVAANAARENEVKAHMAKALKSVLSDDDEEEAKENGDDKPDPPKVKGKERKKKKESAAKPKPALRSKGKGDDEKEESKVKNPADMSDAELRKHAAMERIKKKLQVDAKLDAMAHAGTDPAIERDKARKLAEELEAKEGSKRGKRKRSSSKGKEAKKDESDEEEGEEKEPKKAKAKAKAKAKGKAKAKAKAKAKGKEKKQPSAKGRPRSKKVNDDDGDGEGGGDHVTTIVAASRGGIPTHGAFPIAFMRPAAEMPTKALKYFKQYYQACRMVSESQSDIMSAYEEAFRVAFDKRERGEEEAKDESNPILAKELLGDAVAKGSEAKSESKGELKESSSDKRKDAKEGLSLMPTTDRPPQFGAKLSKYKPVTISNPMASVAPIVPAAAAAAEPITAATGDNGIHTQEPDLFG